MKRAIALLPLLCLIPIADAGAEDPTPDAYQTNFANIIGIIGAGGADWYVSYPTNVPTTGTYHVAVTASTTAAATANIVLTAGSFQGSGCTIGSFTSDTTATSQASGYFPVTVTSAYCFGSVRLTISSGATTITAIRASFQIAADTVTLNGIPDTQDELQALADAQQEFVDDFCGNPQGHGDCNLHIHGGLEVDIADDETVDGVLTIGGTVITNIESNVTLNGDVMVPENKDIRNAVRDWFPLIMALALVAIAAHRENPNYFILGIAGIFMLVSIVYTPLLQIQSGGQLMGVIVFCLAFYLVWITSMGVRDWNESRKAEIAGVEDDYPETDRE